MIILWKWGYESNVKWSYLFLLQDTDVQSYGGESSCIWALEYSRQQEV